MKACALCAEAEWSSSIIYLYVYLYRIGYVKHEQKTKKKNNQTRIAVFFGYVMGKWRDAGRPNKSEHSNGVPYFFIYGD